MKFFDQLPKWQDLSTCNKFLFVCADILYCAVTLGIPIEGMLFAQSMIPFFGLIAVETACGIPPLIPGILTCCSMYKARCEDNQSQEWSEPLEQDYNFGI